MAKTDIDINKNTIMNMLRTDVFGFKANDIESMAKEVHTLVSDTTSNSKPRTDVKMVGGYVRTLQGFIIITPKSRK